MIGTLRIQYSEKYYRKLVFNEMTENFYINKLSIQIMKTLRDISPNSNEKRQFLHLGPPLNEPKSVVTRSKMDKVSVMDGESNDGKQGHRILKSLSSEKLDPKTVEYRPLTSKCEQINKSVGEVKPAAQAERPSNQQIKKEWSDRDDRILKNLILNEKEYDWKTLSVVFGVGIQQVMTRWQQNIYPKVKTTSKVGGALKWSFAEDSILIGYQQKFGSDWEGMLEFLPTRTVYSLEGRWRRITKSQCHLDSNTHRLGLEMPTEARSTNKYQHRKHIIRLIASIAQGRSLLPDQEKSNSP